MSLRISASSSSSSSASSSSSSSVMQRSSPTLGRAKPVPTWYTRQNSTREKRATHSNVQSWP
eukprot:3850487-Amphidinium_carterae.1